MTPVPLVLQCIQDHLCFHLIQIGVHERNVGPELFGPSQGRIRLTGYATPEEVTSVTMQVSENWGRVQGKYDCLEVGPPRSRLLDRDRKFTLCCYRRLPRFPLS